MSSAQTGPPQVPGCASAADCLRFNPGCNPAAPGCLCGSSIFWTQAANCSCANCSYQDFEGFYNWADTYCYNNNAAVAASFQGVACVNPDFSLTGHGKAGPIAGAVAGGIAALALLVTILFVVVKTRRRHIELPQEEEMQTIHVGPKR